MTALIQAQNISLGWLSAMEHLLRVGGKDTNVIVAIANSEQEELHIRHLLDTFLMEHSTAQGKTLYPVVTVANTLFPQALYRPERGEDARPFLYDKYRQSFQVKKRLPANRSGTYFQRMVAWQGKRGEVNQLEAVIQRLKSERKRSNPLSSAYELGISSVEEDEEDAELRVYEPGRDTKVMGFPCLSHISLTLFQQKLHLTALYRNQHFIRRAYGNYVGLTRLLHFLCHEIGCEPGELVCIASHADAELSLGKREITALVEQCKAAISPSAFVNTPS
jgi:hypothetical protein